MTSFDFDIPEKDLAGAEHIANVGRHLIAAFVRKCRADGLTKSELARRLGADKAAVTRMLRGDANLTLRTVGELCWALDVDPTFSCEDVETQLLANGPAPQWTITTEMVSPAQINIVHQ